MKTYADGTVSRIFARFCQGVIRKQKPADMGNRLLERTFAPNPALKYCAFSKKVGNF